MIPDPLSDLRAALEEAESNVLAARVEEDRRIFESTDRLLAGLELGRDAGRWVDLWSAFWRWLVG